MAPHSKLVLVAVALAVVLASAGGVTNVERAGHGGTGGALQPPAPAAAPRAEIDASAAEVLDKKSFPPKGSVNVAYNLARGSYIRFQNQLNKVLRTSRLVEGIPVMVGQSPGAPPTGSSSRSRPGDKPTETITLALRNDNAYIAGFCNAKGLWFSFLRYQSQITGSTALPKITEDYRSLIGGKGELVTLDVNRDAAMDALRFLSTYKPSDDGSKLGTSLAGLIVVVSEAARFTRIFNTVLQGFQQPQHQARLALTDANSVVLWGELSRAIIAFNQTGKWIQDQGQLETLAEAGIKSPQEAIAAVKLIVRPKGFKADEEEE